LPKLSKKELFIVLQTLYAGLVTVGFSYLIGFATQQKILLIAALPLGILLVLLLAWLPARAQLLSWAAVTVWLLSMVYAGTSDIEYIMLFAVVFAAIAGVFWSPWFLAAIWFIHPLWDLIPRDLPEHQHDLPLACLIYDLVVAIYLAWRIRKGFFKDAVVIPTKPERFLSTGLSRTLVAAGVLVVIVIEISVVGMFSMEESSVWFAAPVAIGLIAATLWLPMSAKKIFWMIFTIWTGMTFAHSGEALELVVFGLMIALGVLGYRVSMYYWVGAWGFHALWNLLPREHLSHDAAMMMGHWMVPVAGLIFETTIALYLLWLARRESKSLSATE
jgi:hypothetical protein